MASQERCFVKRIYPFAVTPLEMRHQNLLSVLLQKLFVGFQAKHKSANLRLPIHTLRGRQQWMTHRLIKTSGSLRISQNRCLIFVPMCQDMLT